jgi:hypothetical protein
MKQQSKKKQDTSSVEDFERDFPEMTKQVRDTIEPLFDKTTYPNLRIIVCKMKVKGGKRVIVEYLSRKSEHSRYPISNMFITAWNRKADKSQRDELKAYNIQVHIPSTKKNVAKIITDIAKVNSRKRIHLDELDFGSGGDGLMAQVFSRFKEDSNSTWILYSATPEELTCCEKWQELEANGEGVFVEIDPPENYMGIKEYIDRGLMIESQSMFDFDSGKLSQHGKDVLETAAVKYIESVANGGVVKNIAILRVNGKHSNKSRFNWVVENQSIMQDYMDEAFGKNTIPIYLVDIGSKSSNDAHWDDYKFWNAKHSDDNLFIYLVEQSACRATEFRCHHKLNFYHSHRYSVEPCINTIIQDQERCVYYKLDVHHAHGKKFPAYINLDPSCVIYGDVEVAQYSAGYLNLFELLNIRKDLCPSSRTNVLRFLDKNKIKVHQAKTEAHLDRKLASIYPGVAFGSTYSENKKTPEGFRISSIRGYGVWSKDRVIKENYGIKKGDEVNGRKFVCYEDINDISTELYVALVNDGTKYEGEVITDSPSSMYSK